MTKTRALYLRMLSEDLSHALPYGRGLDNGFTVTVRADDAQVEDLIRQALPSFYGPARTLRDGVRTFVEDAVQTVLFGPATYEIDYLCPADNRINLSPSGSNESSLEHSPNARAG